MTGLEKVLVAVCHWGPLGGRRWHLTLACGHVERYRTGRTPPGSAKCSTCGGQR